MRPSANTWSTPKPNACPKRGPIPGVPHRGGAADGCPTRLEPGSNGLARPEIARFASATAPPPSRHRLAIRRNLFFKFRHSHTRRLQQALRTFVSTIATNGRPINVLDRLTGLADPA